MNCLGSISVAAALSLTLGLPLSGPASTAHAAGRISRIILVQGSPEICTEVYQPVCGTDPNGMRKTYSNACFARIAKATDVTPGECPK
jgi:hypothetical protein